MAISFIPGVSEVVGTASQLSGALSDPITATQVTGAFAVSQGGTGLTSISVGQVSIGTATGGYVGTNISGKYIGYATALTLTATGDQVLTMSAASNLNSYIVRRVTWGMPITGALATCVVVAVLRTASGGGGSAITGSLVLTGLSATTSYLDQAVTLASAVVTATQLFVNVTTAAATAPTSQLFVYGDSLGV